MALWSQADVDALKTAISSGILTVTYEGPPKRSVTYQDLRAMRELLAAMVADVAGQAAGTGRTSYTLISTRKGL